jgi:hypothetical protein
MNVYDIIFDHLSGENKLLARFNGLSVDRVLSKFLTELLDDVYGIFGEFWQKEEKNALYINSDQTTTTAEREEMEFRIRKQFKFSRDRCRYCISGPLDEDYRNLVRKAFVNAGIIESFDPADRLMFVSDAEAFGYHLISTLEIAGKNKFIICDVNYNFVNFAEVIIGDTTTSSVTAKLSQIPDIQGWKPLEKLYRGYLLQCNSDGKAIEQELEHCRQKIKEVTI